MESSGEALSVEVTLEQGLEGFEGLSHAEKSVPGMCESKHNGSGLENISCAGDSGAQVAGIE